MSTISLKQSPHQRNKGKSSQKEHQHEKHAGETIVAPVHKPTRSATTSSENDYVNSEDNTELETRKNDRNENNNTTIIGTVHTPNREISVDGESQINTKILSLIETEMKRDINKHSHFTDSRPQSLSFYEDEKIPEELSGNLELLSPEERKHYKKRKEYLQMDTEERNAYNAIQDLYSQRDNEDIMSSSVKKSKSRKKRHAESEMGMGDSREMMIPKEKKKSKKKKRDGSPAQSSANKRKHKKREEEYGPKSEIALALDELQDDVFENGHEELSNNKQHEKMRKSPRRSDKLYVQRKTKFEPTYQKPSNHLNRQTAPETYSEDSGFGRASTFVYPLDIAICFQKWWMRLCNLCHGLLGGLALGHWLYIVCNIRKQNESFLVHYSYYSDIYVGLFFALCMICIVSVFDRMDVGHLESCDISGLMKNKMSSLIVLIYLACLAVHLSTATYDNKLASISVLNMIDDNETTTSTSVNITTKELNTWNHLSLWRTILAFTAWLFIGLGSPEDSLYFHLKSMEPYLPSK